VLGDTQYGQISTWHQADGNKAVEYTYDADCPVRQPAKVAENEIRTTSVAALSSCHISHIVAGYRSCFQMVAAM
jgi:hypothetical protein